MRAVYTVPWWASVVLMPFYLVAFLVWVVGVILLGGIALSVWAVRWAHAALRDALRPGRYS